MKTYAIVKGTDKNYAIEIDLRKETHINYLESIIQTGNEIVITDDYLEYTSKLTELLNYQPNRSTTYGSIRHEKCL